MNSPGSRFATPMKPEGEPTVFGLRRTRTSPPRRRSAWALLVRIFAICDWLMALAERKRVEFVTRLSTGLLRVPEVEFVRHGVERAAPGGGVIRQDMAGQLRVHVDEERVLAHSRQVRFDVLLRLDQVEVETLELEQAPAGDAEHLWQLARVGLGEDVRYGGHAVGIHPRYDQFPVRHYCASSSGWKFVITVLRWAGTPRSKMREALSPRMARCSSMLRGSASISRILCWWTTGTGGQSLPNNRCAAPSTFRLARWRSRLSAVVSAYSRRRSSLGGVWIRCPSSPSGFLPAPAQS